MERIWKVRDVTSLECQEDKMSTGSRHSVAAVLYNFVLQ
jgi:hypothetical protein